MTTRELIHGAIDRLPDEELELMAPGLLERLAKVHEDPGHDADCGGLLSRLKRIRIQAPADFADSSRLIDGLWQRQRHDL